MLGKKTVMQLKIETLQVRDIPFVSQLIEKSFMESVAPTLSPEGINTFLSGVTPSAIERRLTAGNTFLVCRNKDNIVGVGEIRNQNHLNLLFVEPRAQKTGIGRQLFNELVSTISAKEITVNSSLNSVSAYERFGFQICGPAAEVKGIKYQPMAYTQPTGPL